MSTPEMPSPSSRENRCARIDFVLSLGQLQTGKLQPADLPRPTSCGYLDTEGAVCGNAVAFVREPGTDEGTPVWRVDTRSPSGESTHMCAGLAGFLVDIDEGSSEGEPGNAAPHEASMECLQFYSKHLLLEITENGHVLHCPNVEITIEVGPRVQIVSDVHSPAIKISGEKDPCDFTLAQNDSGVLQTSGTCLFQNKTCIMPQRFMEEQ